MTDDTEEAIKLRDTWELLPPKSSFARTHSSLLISPSLMRRQHTIYEEPNNSYNFQSPIHKVPSLHSLHRMDSNASDGTPVRVVKGSHISKNWYHLTLQKISPTTLNMNKLEKQATIVENELQQTTKMINNACKLRQKWLYKNTENNGHIGALLCDEKMDYNVDTMIINVKSKVEHLYCFKIINGIVQIYNSQTSIENEYFTAHSFDEFLKDLETLHRLMQFGPAKTLSYTRLKILQRRFQLHLLLNSEVELTEISSIPYRDFYNVRKIDNNIHISAGMNQQHLLEFMRNKYNTDQNEIVTDDNKTLFQVFKDLNININHLSVDKLDVHAASGQSTFQRFDKFDAKYNPLGEKTLRSLFLKIENAINGKYLAEMIKKEMCELEKSQYVEYRLTVGGHNKLRWSVIANWVYTHELFSKNVRWIIQVPRIYTTLKKGQLIESFHDIIVNVFQPLFEVTLDPTSNPKLHIFLQRMVGIDVVGDESLPEKMRLTNHPAPKQWNNEHEPPYMYYLYYIYVNVYKLNKLREKMAFNTFSLRPQSGEDGSVNHLASAFLLSHSINHGIRLYYSPILQYLYYLQQIGISVSPLSNSILFQQYDKNPFPRFFQRGLNISLSTDNPLLIHYTKDPLLEEYSIAAQVYGFTSIDLCEIARNSVIQCGWDRDTKKQWIGSNYYDKCGSFGNDIYRTNVPDTRVQFRYFLLKEEREFISKSKHFHDQSVPYFSDFEEEKTKNICENNIKFRDVLESDMKQLCELENKSKEILCFRYMFNRKYLKICTLNNCIIGFVCGIKTKNNLCIDMVFIHTKHRKKGYGTEMMKRYVNNMVKHDSIKSIKMCCEKSLIVFFENVGFKLIGKCQIIEHKNKLCYQMCINVE